MNDQSHLDPRDRNLEPAEAQDRELEVRRHWDRTRSTEVAHRLWALWKGYRLDPGELTMPLLLQAPTWFTSKFQVLITWMRQEAQQIRSTEVLGGSSSVVLAPTSVAGVVGIPGPQGTPVRVQSIEEMNELFGIPHGPFRQRFNMSLGSLDDNINQTRGFMETLMDEMAPRIGLDFEEAGSEPSPPEPPAPDHAIDSFRFASRVLRLADQALPVANAENLRPGDQVQIEGQTFNVLPSSPSIQVAVNGEAPVNVPLPGNVATGEAIATAIQTAVDSRLLAMSRDAVAQLADSGGYLVPEQASAFLRLAATITLSPATFYENKQQLRSLARLLELLTKRAHDSRPPWRNRNISLAQHLRYERSELKETMVTGLHYDGLRPGSAVVLSDPQHEEFRICMISAVRLPWVSNRKPTVDVPQQFEGRWKHGWRYLSCELE